MMRFDREARQSNRLQDMAEITTLDRIDFEIVRLLQNDARLSNKEVAARVGLAPSTCLGRVRRLTAERVLRGFHAEAEPRALGIGLQALLFVRLARHSRRQVEAFRAHALSLRETVALYHVGGRHDFLVHLAVRDADHLRDIALEGFTTRREVAHLETHLLFERISKPELPQWVAPASRARASLPRDAARRGGGGRGPRARARVEP
jgi:DNA-binding Lrp family transcriptional regulator